MSSAMKLLSGNYHEQPEEEEKQKNGQLDSNAGEYYKIEPAGPIQDSTAQKPPLNSSNQHLFEPIIQTLDHKPEYCEIPEDLKDIYGIPDEMGTYTINFKEIRKQQFNKKKVQYHWSGQDVFLDYFDYSKSNALVEQYLNTIRVWPPGFKGILQKIRFQLRLFVRWTVFDNGILFVILLNTLTMSLDHYGIQPEFQNGLKQFNSYFTNIFIFEMGVKLLAYGIVKYCQDKMNWLDGSIVLISIFEIIYLAITAGSNNLSALSTIRMLRTFRIFRIARLLRALESMKTIIDVIQKSYKSFIYITLLMLLFIFIFSLLGMTIYGGKLNFTTGLPRNNFDKFFIAFITIFQILTLENWNDVYVNCMRTSVNKFQTSIFFFVWIFLGTFILLNLFLAILLDSFLGEDTEDEETIRLKQIALRDRKLRAIRRQKRKFLAKVIMTPLQYIQLDSVKVVSDEDLEDLDEDQVVQIFKEVGIMKKNQNEIKEQKQFEGISCGLSLYLFSKDNWIRQKAYTLISSKLWDNFIMFLIVASSFKLAFDTFFLNEPSDSLLSIISSNADSAFSFLFIIEMTIKVIAIGLVMCEGSYLRETWNQLDFFIVSSSILDMMLSGLNIPAIKILRLLRTLRPLRVISHNPALKMIVIALLESVGGIMNVIIVVGVVWLIFGILGVQNFGGYFFYCEIDIYKLHTQTQCERAGGRWRVYDQNFDNIANAMSSLFVTASLEGWSDINFQAIDSQDVDIGPKMRSRQAVSLYFIFFIFVGTFFFLNFFIGVLFLKYKEAQKNEVKGYSEKDLGWIDIQKLILASAPDFETTNVPTSKTRKSFHQLVTSKKFDNFIIFVIILNMFQMMCQYEAMNLYVSFLLDFSNYIFTFIFVVEASLKITAFGSSYFSTLSNKIDIIVVLSSIFDILLAIFDDGSTPISAIAPQIVRIMRILRCTRIIRLANKSKGLSAIIQTIIFSFPSLMNVFMLLMLIFFMFSILGVFMFSNVQIGNVIGSSKNFNNFWQAFKLLFAISSGESWNLVMFDCTRVLPDCIPGLTCGNKLGYYYFYFMVLMCTYIMLNLFILVIIQQFEKYYLPKENMIALFKNDLANFMEIWKQLTMDKYRCQKIKESYLKTFFILLGQKGDKESSLGFNAAFYTDEEIGKLLLRMGIKNENGFVYFGELLYRAIRRKYGNYKSTRIMHKIELQTQYIIYKSQLKSQKRDNIVVTDDMIYQNLIKKTNSINPFLTQMNLKISFKTWLKHAQIILKKKAFQLVLTDEAKNDEEFQKALQDFEEFQKPKIYKIITETTDQYSVTSEEDDGVQLIREKDSYKFKKKKKQLSSESKNSIQKKLENKMVNDLLVMRFQAQDGQIHKQRIIDLRKQNIS